MRKEFLYSGGYSDQALTPLSGYYEIKIADMIASNQTPKKLPLKGCAQSKRYQTILDPLGLKYRRSI